MTLAKIFPSVSRLAAEHSAQGLDLIRAQDEIRALKARVASLELDLYAARNEAREARERVTDWLAERMFGKPIYGHSPDLQSAEPSAQETAQAFEPKRKQARQVARELEAQFFREAGIDTAGAPASL